MDPKDVEAALLRDLAGDSLTLLRTEAALADVVRKAAPDLRAVNEVAAALARTQAASLVEGLTKAKQQRLRTLIARAIDQGWSDTKTNEAIRSVVGLDDRYARAVEAYRAGLIAQGQPAGRARMAADSYAKRLLKARAARIARTEVQKALLDAQRLMWTQQQEDGDLSRYAVRVVRLHKDERLCKVCRPLNGRRVSLRKGAGVEVQGVLFPGPPFHPNCRCYEEVSDEGIAKTDPVLWGIRKHLPGLHDQKTHGRRSGLRVDIVRHLEEASGQGGPKADFALAIMDMAAEFPEVARHIRGVNLNWNGDAVGHEWTGAHGHQIDFNPDRAKQHIERLKAGEEAPVKGVPADMPDRYGYAVAVHEFGHAVHAHLLAAKMGRIEVEDLDARMHQGIFLDGVRPVSRYAMQNNGEMFAEWWTAWRLGLMPADKPVDPAFQFALERALEQEVEFGQRAIVAKEHGHTCDLDGSVVEQYALGGGSGPTLSSEFRFRHLMRRRRDAG